MEDRNGWQRVLQAAHDFDVVAMCSPFDNADVLHASVPSFLRDRIRIIPVQLSAMSRYFLSTEILFYRGYRSWLGQCRLTAQEMQRNRPFQFSHLVSLCSYRETGCLWKIGCPSIIGPLGGTSGFRWSYLPLIDFWGGMFEVARNIINSYQTRFSYSIRRSIRNSRVVIAANTSTRDDLQHYSGNPIPVSLETGIDYPISDPKPDRKIDQPLKILWAGRLRAWKALPLLLYAISKLPSDVTVSLKVMGDGKCKRKWKRLAQRLKIENRIEWIKRPIYRDSLKYYREADVFAFTSLRDTSGTGLLEALTAGTPILGLNHQGAADIITAECGVPISVQCPRQSIEEFRDAILSLYWDSKRLKQLCDGALQRAKKFQWSSYEEPMRQIYNQISAESHSKRCDVPIVS